MSFSRFCRSLSSLLRSMPKYHYAVRVGRSSGVYDTWEKCRNEVNGFAGARYKKFATAEEAWNFVKGSDSGAAVGGSKPPGPTRSKPEFPHPASSTSKRKLKVLTDADFCTLLAEKRLRQEGFGTASSSSSSSTPSQSSSERGRVVVYTDGSCESNGRRGARAGVGVYWGDDSPHNTSERLEGKQTNQRAEITAAIRAVQTAKSRGIKEITLYTDSKYTINAITDWIKRWKVNGWKTVNRKEVLNKEDLQTLDSLCQDVSVDWKYVPGHSNIKGNEAADSLARAGTRMHSA